MIKRLLAASVALAVLIGGAAALGLAGAAPPAYTITADVPQAPNLFRGGRVMVRGVRVGSIEAVEPRPGGVRLTLSIEEGVEVPADARLLVVPITIIADRYVQLDPAYEGGPTLADGDHIPLEQTVIPAELDDVLTELKGLLSALEPAPGEERGPLAELVESLDHALDGRSRELAGTLRSSADVFANLARSDAEISGLIANLDRFFLALANRSSEIGIVNERFRTVFESLVQDRANLEGTIVNLAFLSDQTASLIEESGESLGTSFDRLEKVLDAVLRHQESLRRGIRWANVVTRALGATDASGKGLYAYSGRQAPPGSEGAAYNYRIDSRDTVGCRRINNVATSILAVNPQAGLEDFVHAVFVHIPAEKRDDLEFLVRLLVPLCVDALRSSALEDRAARAVEDLANRIGPERLHELLSTPARDRDGGRRR